MSGTLSPLMVTGKADGGCGKLESVPFALVAKEGWVHAVRSPSFLVYFYFLRLLYLSVCYGHNFYSSSPLQLVLCPPDHLLLIP